MNENIYSPSVEVPKMEVPEKKHSFSSSLVDFIQSAVLIGATFISIHLFVAQTHKVSGASMVPTFQNNDYILTEKVSYRFRSPQKGDIIVLKNPKNESQDFIKRVIATPGDTIEIKNGFVFINDVKIDEKYLTTNIPTKPGAFLEEDVPIKLGDDQYFVFGDNRSHSSDSREWGPIKKNEIIGKVFFRYLPIGNFGPNL